MCKLVADIDSVTEAELGEVLILCNSMRDSACCYPNLCPTKPQSSEIVSQVFQIQNLAIKST